jgi:hypothetical protein
MQVDISVLLKIIKRHNAQKDIKMLKILGIALITTALLGGAALAGSDRGDRGDNGGFRIPGSSVGVNPVYHRHHHKDLIRRPLREVAPRQEDETYPPGPELRGPQYRDGGPNDISDHGGSDRDN